MRKLAAVLLAAATGTAVADGPQPLSVVVRGTIDGSALRAQIARELGIVVAPADKCPQTCLEIAIADDRVTIVYTPANAPARTRVVDLGKDRAQWPLVITLLAGNVVRDEAADLLAQLPTPAPKPEPAPVADPAPEPAPVEPAPEPPPVGPGDPAFVIPPTVAAPAPVITRDVLFEQQRPTMPFIFGFVPGLSTDGLLIGRVRHAVGLHLIAGVTGGSDVLSIGGIADVQNGDASGLQLGGIVAAARGVRGFQVGGIAAVSRDTTGVQVGGIAAVSGSSTGFQLGGIAAFSRGRGDVQVGGIATFSESSAVQLGGIATVARGTANYQVAGIATAAVTSNVQLAGIATASKKSNIQVAGIATTTADGNIQVAGITNAARTANTQVAGIVNIAGSVRGVQIAPINIAKRVEGVQVGVVNIGGDADGFSFGLINIVPGGRADLEAGMDSGRVGTLLFRHGGNRWHNVYGIAGHPVDENGGKANDVWMYGLGFGPSWKVPSGRVDAELMGWQVNHGTRHSTDVSILGQLRLSYAHSLGPIAIVAGGILNAYVSNDQMSPLLVERREPGAPITDKVTVEVWPSAFVGLRL